MWGISGTLLTVEECALNDHDISLPFSAKAGPRGTSGQAQQLRVLVLSARSMSDGRWPAILQRIQHFSSTSGGQYLALTFLMLKLETIGPADRDQTNPVVSFARLQCELVSNDVIAIPLLVISDVKDLPEVLRNHVECMSRTDGRKEANTHASDLLPFCSTGPALSPFAVSIASELFLTLKDLALAAATIYLDQHSHPQSEVTVTDGLDAHVQGLSYSEKLDILREQLGADLVDSMIDLWRDEWVAE